MQGKQCFWLGIGMGILAVPTGASPWGLGEGESLAIVGVTLTQHNELVLYNGEHRSIPEVQFVSYSFSGEYGLTDDWMLSLHLPYEVAHGADRTMAPRVSAGGDLRLAAQRAIWREEDHDLALAGAVAFKFPGSPYRTDVLSAPGDGQEDLEFRLLAGRNIGSWIRPAYWDAETGYRFRQGSPGDEFFLYLEYGQQFDPRWGGRLFFDHTNQLSGFGLEAPNWTPGDFPSVEEDLDRLGLGVTYSLRDDLWLDLFYAHLVHVDNSALGWHLGISLGSYRMAF